MKIEFLCITQVIHALAYVLSQGVSRLESLSTREKFKIWLYVEVIDGAVLMM
jgi:hypothetical protein